MATAEKAIITIKTTVKAPVEKVWKIWNDPAHIIKWNTPGGGWHTPRATNDLRVGGKLLSRMEAEDGSAGFDFEGIYDSIVENKSIIYTIADGRKVNILFEKEGENTLVTESFEAEETNPIEMQQGGWQAILNNFKTYTESLTTLNKLQFQIDINAPVEKVYQKMLAKDTYEEWTKVFNEGSKYEGSWDKGAKIVFLGTDSQGRVGGMVSRIEENIPNKFVSIKHLGIIQDGKEITTGPEVDGWAGAFEIYSYENKNGKTLLIVDIDSNTEFANYLEGTYPKALKALKELCEK